MDIEAVEDAIDVLSSRRDECVASKIGYRILQHAIGHLERSIYVYLFPHKG